MSERQRVRSAREGEGPQGPEEKGALERQRRRNRVTEVSSADSGEDGKAPEIPLAPPHPPPQASPVCPIATAVNHLCAKSLHMGLFETPWTVACQAPLSVGFSRQEYWGGLPCPPPGESS